MRRVLNIVIVSFGLLLLAGCASHTKNPAGITDANNMQGTAATIQAQGYGEMGDVSELNSLKKDVGPHYGVLAARSFYFLFDKNNVNPKDIPIIKAHARYLLKNPRAKVLLEGNTDSRGSREYNVALGQRRANAVKNILRMQGVSNRQIRTISYGAEKPVALGRTESAYRLNRRVDLRYEAK
jgi:peptidoglycan-associated lipoprotein